jgi:ADP-dependent phosphofructokinase/glucokinase
MNLLIIGLGLLVLGTMMLTTAIVGTLLYLQHKKETEAKQTKTSLHKPESREKIEKFFDSLIKSHLELNELSDEEVRIPVGSSFSPYVPVIADTPKKTPKRKKCKRKT